MNRSVQLRQAIHRVCCNTLLHIELADDCLDRYSQYGPFFVHIQLAVDHAKNYYSLCSVTL